jgi:methylated-DNA-[protein]-cysteine S-methyltransferase
MIFHTTIENTLGRILLVSDGSALTGLFFRDGKHHPEFGPEWRSAPDHPIFQMVESQLTEYLSGKRRRFEIPCSLQGTPFQKSVWTAIGTITFGATASYRDIAKKVGNSKSARAVGTSAGRNPISVIIPCHRVIGQNGSLTGYGGGLERKRVLLELEIGTEKE